MENLERHSVIFWSATTTTPANMPLFCSVLFANFCTNGLSTSTCKHRTGAFRTFRRTDGARKPADCRRHCHRAPTLSTPLGMTTHRVVFHYGIELEGLKYNSLELGELRRRTGANLRVDLTFDPGDLGHINVLDSRKGSYIRVPALDQAYASRLSLWQHKVIRRYTQRQLDSRTDMLALAQAKAEIRELVDRDFHRKSTRGRKRHARFLSEPMPTPFAREGQETPRAGTEARVQQRAFTDAPSAAEKTYFSDDDIVPVFEATLDLPHPFASVAVSGETHLPRRKHECNHGLFGTSVGEISVVHYGSETYPGMLG